VRCVMTLRSHAPPRPGIGEIPYNAVSGGCAGWIGRAHPARLHPARHVACISSLTSALEHALLSEVAARAGSIAPAVRGDGAQLAAERLPSIVEP
jgi:hypothetical protein